MEREGGAYRNTLVTQGSLHTHGEGGREGGAYRNTLVTLTHSIHQEMDHTQRISGNFQGIYFKGFIFRWYRLNS